MTTFCLVEKHGLKLILLFDVNESSIYIFRESIAFDNETPKWNIPLAICLRIFYLKEEHTCMISVSSGILKLDRKRLWTV